jgi:serine/threonine-protein kinase
VVRAGALYCWGDNAEGQLGVGDLVAREAPTLVAGMDADVTAVKAGAAHTCAIKGGALYCWGEGADGQSGGASAPELVAGFDAGVTALALGDAHTCAIKAGEAWCWGRNDVGQLGDGTTSASVAPRKVVGLGTSQTRLSSGAAHVCSDGGCWGDNAAGQLGVAGMAFSAFAVAANADHLGGARSCRIDDQRFYCVQMSAPGVDQVVAAALGAEHVCLIASNALKCWGDNAKGQLGVAALASSDMFVTVVDQPPSLLFAGFDSACAAFGEELRCWGDNAKGQLGIPAAPPIVAAPTAVLFP